MATYKELQTYVKDVIQDNKYNHLIRTFLNQAQLEIAGGLPSMLGDWLTPPLPGLLTIDTITTDITDPYVHMPANFHRNLQFAASSNGNEINIADSFLSFSEVYPLLDKVGSVTECCEFGGNFYYQGIPSSVATITIHYYRLPEDMSDNDDTPDSIPLHLHKSLLGNYAIWKVLELMVEEDIIHETNREIILNKYTRKMQLHRQLFFEALRILELFIPYNIRTINLISN
jgi:hypothetical protein